MTPIASSTPAQTAGPDAATAPQTRRTAPGWWLTARLTSTGI
ncbi:hypothetical protein [Paracoccus marcusii]|uniref:Uncharacterized protein n=1 Tax=Paracoccus marcusii TaxID=59779 RepID=A0ABY7UUP5_9RHOB|nr:hypothetical protein [Paracoccus marcusii]WDA13666.1 hypothetical protein PRL19_05265 [Paracoccus marcusii]